MSRWRFRPSRRRAVSSVASAAVRARVGLEDLRPAEQAEIERALDADLGGDALPRGGVVARGLDVDDDSRLPAGRGVSADVDLDPAPRDVLADDLAAGRLP
jgi:hypothetical protein